MTTLSRFFHHLYFLCQKELLTLFKDPRMRIQLIMPVIIEGFLFGYAANYNIEEVPYAVVDTSGTASSRDFLAHIAQSPTFSCVAICGNATEIGPLIDAGDLLAAGVIPQVMFLAGLSIAKEREQGTFDQLLVTPFSPTEILIGKATPPVLVGLFQAAMVFLIARYWFEVPFAGNLFTLFLTLLIFMVSTTGLGLSISSVARNMQQVLVYLLVLMIPMVLLSGLVTPVDNMPAFLQAVTYADPMRFVIDAVRRIYLEGASLGEIAWDFVPMLAVAAVTMPLAGWLFRHKTT